MKRAFSIVLAWLTLLIGSLVAQAGELDYTGLPTRSQTYGPLLMEQLETYWPEMQSPSICWAQVEQETCITLTHKYCWSPTAQLKTSREQGAGLGQITRAWNKDGSLRFDALEELRRKHREALDGWSWLNVSDATFQLRGLVLMDRDLYQAFSFAETELDRYAFMDAGYNGGQGGVLSDRAICQSTPGCNPNVWLGNVELYSKKARTAANGYGKGFYYINREHVGQVVYGIQEGQTKTRRARYQKAGLP